MLFNYLNIKMSYSAHFYSIINTLIFGLIGFILWKLFTFINRFRILNQSLRSVPCLHRHWLLGNSRKGQIVDSQSYIDTVLGAANAGHKLFCVWIGPFPAVSVIHADTFKEAIKQTREKCKGLIDAYGFLDGWLEDKLAADTTNGMYVDVFPYACKMTLDTLLRCLLSYDGDIQTNATNTEKAYIDGIKRICEITLRRAIELPLLIQPVFRLHPVGREYYRLCDQVHQFTGNIIRSRIKENMKNQSDESDVNERRLDFLDILLTAKDEEGRGLSQQEIQDEVDTFTFAGHDTTASAISWAIYALGKHPDLQQKVYKDVCDVLGDSDAVTKDHLGQFTYLPLFIKEVLRYYTPVPIIGRANFNSSITLDGIEIPPNVSLYLQLYAIHHNERVWPKAEVFDPERFNVSQRDQADMDGFFPFSVGARNCIGQVFAKNEMKISLAKLVKRFEVECDPTNEAILLHDIVTRPKNGIHVRLKKRD